MFVLLNGILNGHLVTFPATLKTGKKQKKGLTKFYRTEKNV